MPVWMGEGGVVREYIGREGHVHTKQWHHVVELSLIIAENGDVETPRGLLEALLDTNLWITPRLRRRAP